ncbi:glycosyl transferase group 1 [Catenulispora acidiphila DSM 44928]|uniref:Glycosyl transferase group 1 n=1 Tax=Catenulispora acidiphila (strain DSM 44928 / JCM 14897 / NBRC 102108 / NRRL B-24433 / ID139908) TaxID=479433 RepID=C7Q7J9_CATAD|nr:glycosyltransferase [Catenulispora acidiphila]ACU72192.1 glycosyl transferase group 1 [Catenulispora acidiphila DSM 44928]
MRIVQLANAYTPNSGGLRTVVDELGRGYVAAGHERVLVIPGQRHSREEGESGLVVTLPSVPVSGGYRMIPRFSPVRELLEELQPDTVEVSDKATLAAAGPWARQRGVGAVLISHERLDAVAAARFPHAWRASHRALKPALHRRSRRLATRFDAVVVASAFAGTEFAGTSGFLREIPLGVDLDTFCPNRNERPVETEEPRGTGEHPWRLVYSGRLSVEKNPIAAIAAVRALISEDVPVHLDVYGTGSQRDHLERVAAELPITFHGYLADRAELAARIAEADVVIAPGPAETFGLTVLESLACGTPVVTADTGGAGELLAAGAGIAAASTGADMARAVAGILAWPEAERRAAARHRAEQFPWSATIASMLDVHAVLAARERSLNRLKRRGLRRRMIS